MLTARTTDDGQQQTAAATWARGSSRAAGGLAPSARFLSLRHERRAPKRGSSGHEVGSRHRSGRPHRVRGEGCGTTLYAVFPDIAQTTEGVEVPTVEPLVVPDSAKRVNADETGIAVCPMCQTANRVLD